MTEDYAPCLIPVDVSNTNESFPNNFNTQSVVLHIHFKASNIVAPIPFLTSDLKKRNLENLSNAFVKLRNRKSMILSILK